MYGFIMACIELYEARIWLPVALKKKIQTHPPKPTEAKPSFRKVSLSPAKQCMLFPLTSRLESFGHKTTPSDRPWIEAYCPKFQQVQIWVGPRMLKVNFLEYLGQENLYAIHFSSCSAGASAAPQIFTFTPASYSH